MYYLETVKDQKVVQRMCL